MPHYHGLTQTKIDDLLDDDLDVIEAQNFLKSLYKIRKSYVSHGYPCSYERARLSESDTRYAFIDGMVLRGLSYIDTYNYISSTCGYNIAENFQPILRELEQKYKLR